jgi:hypothetical protein
MNPIFNIQTIPLPPSEGRIYTIIILIVYYIYISNSIPLKGGRGLVLVVNYYP